MNILLAVETNSANEILKQNVETGKMIQDSLRETWKDVFTGPLFVNLSTIGALIALIFLAWWCLAWLKIAFDPGSKAIARSAEQIFIAALICLLLGTPVNRGKLLGTLVLGGHDVMQGVTNSLLDNISKTVNDDVINQAQAKNSFVNIGNEGLKYCVNFPDTTKRNACFEELDGKLYDIKLANQNSYWAQSTYDQYHTQIQNLISFNFGSSEYFGQIFSSLGAMAGDVTGAVSTTLIRSLLITFGSAFLVGIEICMMLTGLVCPIFLGMSYFTPGWTSISSWTIGYFGLGLVLLFFKLQLGLVSIAILKSPVTDPLLFPMAITLVSIPFSFILVGGGGIALFSSLARSIRGGN